MKSRLNKKINTKLLNYKVINNKLYIINDDIENNNVLNLSQDDYLRYLTWDINQIINYNLKVIKMTGDLMGNWKGRQNYFKINILVSNDLLSNEQNLSYYIVNYYDFLGTLIERRNHASYNVKNIIYYNFDKSKEIYIDLINNTCTYSENKVIIKEYYIFFIYINTDMTNFLTTLNNAIYNENSDYYYFPLYYNDYDNKSKIYSYNAKCIILYDTNDFIENYGFTYHIDILYSVYRNISKNSLFEVNIIKNNKLYKFLSYTDININNQIPNNFKTRLTVARYNFKYEYYLPMYFNYNSTLSQQIKPFYIIKEITNTYENIINSFKCNNEFNPTYYNKSYSETNLFDSTMIGLDFNVDIIYDKLRNNEILWLKDKTSDLCLKFQFIREENNDYGHIEINNIPFVLSVKHLDLYYNFIPCKLSKYNNCIEFDFELIDFPSDYYLKLLFNISDGVFLVDKSYVFGAVLDQLIFNNKFSFDIIFIQNNEKNLNNQINFDNYYTKERILSIFNGQEPQYISPLFKQFLDKNNIILSSVVKDPSTIKVLNNNILNFSNKFIYRYYYKTGGINYYEDNIIVLKNNQNYYIEQTKLKNNLLYKYFTKQFNFPRTNYNEFLTLLAWNENLYSNDNDNNYLTFALDIQRNLYKFNNNIKVSSIKNLININPLLPNNN